MFLNKTVLITTLTLFACTACVSLTDNTAQQAQQAQISKLQTELLQVTETNQQTQTELTTLNNTLTTCQNRVDELASLLEKAEQENREKIAATACREITQLNDKTTLGQTEWVYVSTAKSNYRARIDTGAATSSINASDIERFERDGKKWVRFSLSHEKGDAPQVLEAKIERIVRIAQSTNIKEQAERRFVIKLHVRIGDISHQTEFTLTDRSHMEYPVLIGRSFMQDVILVDVSKEYIYRKYKVK